MGCEDGVGTWVCIGGGGGGGVSPFRTGGARGALSDEFNELYPCCWGINEGPGIGGGSAAGAGIGATAGPGVYPY